jgi:hypothetical protein
MIETEKRYDSNAKPWQHGYSKDYLQEITDEFAPFNRFSCSPFSEMNKRVVAEALYTDTLQSFYSTSTDGGTAHIEVVPTKTSTSINMYKGVEIARKLKGDLVIKKICYSTENAKEWVEKTINKIEDPLWVYSWQEDTETNEMLEKKCGCEKVGTKITTFAEIINIYFKQPYSLFGQRKFTPIAWYENCAVDQLNITADVDALEIARKRLESVEFSNHYSNYNAKNSWGALSLRGYTNDPADIEKPEEMNKKWKKANADREFKLQDTPLREEFPELEPIIDSIPGEKHRIRFMRLTPDGGTLGRHTDQVDPDAGMADGKLMRIHIPVQTNEKVQFCVWDLDGKKHNVNMKVGTVWNLDTRKPHMVVNDGECDRIHLVIDVETTPELRELLNSEYEPND